MHIGSFPLKNEGTPRPHPKTDENRKEPDGAEATVSLSKQDDEHDPKVFRSSQVVDVKLHRKPMEFVGNVKDRMPKEQP